MSGFINIREPDIGYTNLDDFNQNKSASTPDKEKARKIVPFPDLDGSHYDDLKHTLSDLGSELSSRRRPNYRTSVRSTNQLIVDGRRPPTVPLKVSTFPFKRREVDGNHKSVFSANGNKKAGSYLERTKVCSNKSTTTTSRRQQNTFENFDSSSDSHYSEIRPAVNLKCDHRLQSIDFIDRPERIPLIGHVGTESVCHVSRLSNERDVLELVDGGKQSARVQRDPFLISQGSNLAVQGIRKPIQGKNEDYGCLKPLGSDFRYAYPNLWQVCKKTRTRNSSDFLCTKYRLTSQSLKRYHSLFGKATDKLQSHYLRPLSLKVYTADLEVCQLPEDLKKQHLTGGENLDDSKIEVSVSHKTGGNTVGKKHQEDENLLVTKKQSDGSRNQIAATELEHKQSESDAAAIWKKSDVSDSESVAEIQSELCGSLESLADIGSDETDANCSSVHSDGTDDVLDPVTEEKFIGKGDLSWGCSPSTPEELYTPAEDHVASCSADSELQQCYPVTEEKQMGIMSDTYSWLRFSLFPGVPPTINFRVSDSSESLNIPPEVKKVLKWKSTSVTPIVVRRVLFNSGMRIVKRSRQWVGVWAKHMRAGVFKTLKEFQKFNHFPGTFQIGRKDTLWRNHNRLRVLHGRRSFDFVPATYVIPADMKQLRLAWDKGGPQQMWIVKPPASARGSGIKVVHKFVQIPKIRPLVVQKYLSSPFLINGVKFDLRIYVYVTSFFPLRIYVYKEGLVRFASVMYSACPRTVGDRYMHLTNYSINRKSVTYTANEDMDACHGHKWSLKALWGYLADRGHNTTAIWNSIVDIIIKTIISCETTVVTLSRLNLRNSFSCHELFGFDIILDNKLKPWLLEVNISPSLQSSSKLDVNIKGHMCKDLLNLSGIMIPAHVDKAFQASLAEKLTKDVGVAVDNVCFDKRLYRSVLTLEERAKQVAYAHMDRHEYLSTILDNLIPDDIRQLVLMEDERCRAGQYIRVFPTHATFRYLKYFERPRYYNHLFDAWETRYHNAREEGQQRLVAACEQGMHLKMVPKDSSKVGSPKSDLGRLSSSSSLRIRCCSRNATNRAIQRACRSARNLLARMRIPQQRLQPTSVPPAHRIMSPHNGSYETKSLGTPSTQASCDPNMLTLRRIQLARQDDGDQKTVPDNALKNTELVPNGECKKPGPDGDNNSSLNKTWNCDDIELGFKLENQSKFVVQS